MNGENSVQNLDLPNEEVQKVISVLETVYDPEFPFLDIYNMGLIYEIKVFDKKIHILMSLTTPACPAADMIVGNVKESIEFEFPDKECEVEITFEPSWTIEMIKDEDLKRMFE